MTRWMMRSTGVSLTGCKANRLHSGIGNDSTFCRTDTRGRILSTRSAAVSAMRRVPHDGQMPRRLQLKATRVSRAQPSQVMRRNPWARMPHSR